MLGLPWACCWQLCLGVQGMSDGNYFTLPQRSSAGGCIKVFSIEVFLYFLLKVAVERARAGCAEGGCVCPALL